MLDTTVPMIGLVMRLDSLDRLPSYDLPSQFRWRCYRPGDEFAWARIEMSAGEFNALEPALEAFCSYFPDIEALKTRMLFLTDGDMPFATATAWYGDGVAAREGRLHWVGIDEAHQRMRLSFPLVSLAMARMRALRHTSAFLTTQTVSWPAIKVYHQFGFKPFIQKAEEAEGWRIVSQKSGIDFTRII